MMETIEAYKDDLLYTSKHLDLESESSIVGIYTGSFSDFPKMADFFIHLNKEQVKYLLSIASIHRTGMEAMQMAQEFPNIYTPINLQDQTFDVKSKIKFALGAAGGAAHLPGVMGGETRTTPVISLPIESTSCGIIPATFSMLDMPPLKPTGFSVNNTIAANMVEKLYKLQLDSDFTNIQIPEGFLDKESEKLLKQLGLTIGESSIGLDIHNMDENNNLATENDIPIIIPTVSEVLSWDNVGKMRNLTGEGLYMGTSMENNVKLGNALIYAAKLIGMFNPNVRQRVDAYIKEGEKGVLSRNAHLFEQQFYGEWKQ